METVELSIKGMTCASCVNAIEKHIKSIDGVYKIAVSLLSEKCMIEFDSRRLKAMNLCEEIENIGFEATVVSADNFQLMLEGSDVDSKLGGIKGVLRFEGRDSLFSISFDSNITSKRVIVDTLRQADVTVLLPAEKRDFTRGKEVKEWQSFFIFSLIFSLPEFLLSMFFMDAGFLKTEILKGFNVMNLLELCLTTPVQYHIGRKFFKRAMASLKHKTATMDLLITIGTSSAYFSSIFAILFSMISREHFESFTFFETSTTLFTFVTLGRLLEAKAKGQACSSLTNLIALKPRTCRVVQLDVKGMAKSENIIETDLLSPKEMVKVLPGENIPIDGVVHRGASFVNESMVTGESSLVSKREGALVVAGSLNTNGVLIISALKVGEDTLLSKIVQLVEDAQSQKASIQAVADNIAGYFVPIVLVLGCLTFVAWLFIIYGLGIVPMAFQGEGSLFLVCLKMSISVIVVACPCAIGLATPTAIMVGTGVAAENGILIKNPQVIEKAAKLRTVLFDKTGTLTKGELTVTKIIVLEKEMSFEMLLTLAGALEEQSEHPIAKSVVQYSKNELLMSKFSANVEEIEIDPGYGLSALVHLFPQEKYAFKGSFNVSIGNKEYLEKKGFSLSSQIISEKERYENSGMTVIFMVVESELVGYFVLCDEIKLESKSTVEALRLMNLSVVMATGDQQKTAESLARRVGIDTIYSKMTPTMKYDLVSKLKQEGPVAMVGDGINDSPALALSDIGVAVYNGTDIAIDASAIVLMRKDISDVVVALMLCNKIYQRILINFCWASGYNLIGIPLAAGLFVPFGLVLTPSFAGFAMAFSSVSVVLSSLSLKFFKKPSKNTHKVIEEPTISRVSSMVFEELKQPTTKKWRLFGKEETDYVQLQDIPV